MGKHGHPTMPRVFIVRHGQTEWSLNGRHTGTTDIPLTQQGVELIKGLAPQVVGDGKLLDPKNLQQVYVSPRQRAQQTFDLLFEGSEKPPMAVEEGVREWTYGDYEGLTSSTIKEQRGKSWDIWTEGCPGGESAQEMSDRCDEMIAKILKRCQDHHAKKGDEDGQGDVLIVSHGHFTRCFLTRWCQLPLTQGRIFVSDTGAISVCGYQHGSFEERSLLGTNLYGQL
ncbi:histidine phosphatase superfamily [Leucosporidium creatinivorum]|uniref:Histidine phosphatase superfamily n=1 Tax=Leucosporidium creatinivorum TaxID=106004 RepID=A0A1Y2G205_9BASI|nr:histidine phosphatase superfamily [Leucosporidium creatinivorum]